MLFMEQVGNNCFVSFILYAFIIIFLVDARCGSRPTLVHYATARVMHMHTHPAYSQVHAHPSSPQPGSRTPLAPAYSWCWPISLSRSEKVGGRGDASDPSPLLGGRISMRGLRKGTRPPKPWLAAVASAAADADALGEGMVGMVMWCPKEGGLLRDDSCTTSLRAGRQAGAGPGGLLRDCSSQGSGRL